LKNKKSLLEWVRTSAESDNTIFGWTTHYWNGITCLQYCKIIEMMIQNNLFWKGVRHINSPTAVSKYALICMIKQIYNLDNLRVEMKTTDRIVNKTLFSRHPNIFKIPELSEQINELKGFVLK
jgi:dTDP-4-dehydrorhamnose reductase